MTASEHALGHIFETPRALIFFGDRRSTQEAVEVAFPDLRVLTLKQTHSDIVISSPYSKPSPEADSHFTREKKLAICIRTADCIPVMIHDPESGIVAAIHAGWRGVENEIIVKTCARLRAEGATLARAEAWIGPHIGVNSFEVGRDVGENLERAFQKSLAVLTSSRASITPPQAASALRAHPDPAKVRVDLLQIARAQLQSCGIMPDRHHLHAIDTFTAQGHESHRRDRDHAGRQISFIALNR